MPTHQEIDRRSLRLAEEVARCIDRDPSLLEKARDWVERFYRQAAPRSETAVLEWRSILKDSWPEIRAILLDPGERGQKLRQSSPFAGVLTPQERWRIYRESRPT